MFYMFYVFLGTLPLSTSNWGLGVSCNNVQDEVQLILFQKPWYEPEIAAQNLYVNHSISEALPDFSVWLKMLAHF